MKRIFLSFILAASASAQTAVDFYLDMEAGTNGQTITTNLLASRTHTADTGHWTFNRGAYGSYAEISSVTGFTVVSNVAWASKLRSSVTVSGTTYDNADHSRVIGYSLTNRDQGAQWNFGTARSQLSIGYYYAMARGFSLNPVYIGNILSVSMRPTGGDFDIMGGSIQNLQAELNVHTLSGAGTQINIEEETIYWVTQLYDGTAGTAKVEVYNPTTWEKVGATSTLDLGQYDCVSVQFGDMEQTLSDNKFLVTNCFGNLIMDWTTATWPLLLPAATNQPSVVISILGTGTLGRMTIQ